MLNFSRISYFNPCHFIFPWSHFIFPWNHFIFPSRHFCLIWRFVLPSIFFFPCTFVYFPMECCVWSRVCVHVCKVTDWQIPRVSFSLCVLIGVRYALQGNQVKWGLGRNSRCSRGRKTAGRMSRKWKTSAGKGHYIEWEVGWVLVNCELASFWWVPGRYFTAWVITQSVGWRA